jgi:CheY-like chemotaxis protein
MSQPSPSPARVLIIDDDPLVAVTLQRLLREHRTEVASSAHDALARLAAGERYDVVLCDLMMPGTDGAQFYAELEHVAPECRERIIFVTGGAFTDKARAFLDSVPNEVVEKPFDPSKLRALVQRYVR